RKTACRRSVHRRWCASARTDTRAGAQPWKGAAEHTQQRVSCSLIQPPTWPVKRGVSMRIEPRQRLLSLAPLSLAASLLAASGSVSSQTDVRVLPVNAHTSRYGSGWECSRGFRRVEEACVAIKVPANAYLNSFGSDWDCNRGYRKVDQGCKAVKVPAGAHPDDEPF